MTVEELTALPVALPLIAAAMLLVVERFTKRRWVLDTLTILTVIAVLLIDCGLLVRAGQGNIVYWFGGWRPSGGAVLGISFVVDPLGAGLAAFTAFLTF